MVDVEVEVAVVGGGVMGAATAWQLAERGREVVLLEQFGPGHEHGSSHGNARIFRLAYPEADYLALARGALPLWDQMEAETGRTLRRRMGELDHGEPGIVGEIARQLADATVEHQVLTPEEAAVRWPGLVVDRAAVFHPDGGTSDAAESVVAAHELAVDRGAQVRHHCQARRLEPAADHVALDVRTADPDAGSTVTSERLVARTVVVTAGGWAPGLLTGHLRLPPMAVTREQPVHVAPTGPPGPEPWPSFIHYSRQGPPKTSGIDEAVWGYGVPTPDGRIKLGEHHTGEVVWSNRDGDGDGRNGGADRGQDRGPEPFGTADAVDEVSLERVKAYARRWLPGVDADSAVPERCLYTTTPTTDFVLDRVGPIVVGAGFSGHGFKFAPRIGELLADLVDGASAPSRFRLPG